MKKDILVFVASEFEDVELIATLDIFVRNEVTFDLVSIENKDLVKGQQGCAFVETIHKDDIEFNEYKGLFLPGGKGHLLLLEDKFVLETIKKFNDDKKIIAAICAAPEVLKKAGVLEGIKRYTSFPGFAKGENNLSTPVEISDNIITGRDFEATIMFAKEIVKKIK